MIDQEPREREQFKFDEHATRAIKLAASRATIMGLPDIDTENLLLGLIQEGYSNQTIEDSSTKAKNIVFTVSFLRDNRLDYIGKDIPEDERDIEELLIHMSPKSRIVLQDARKFAAGDGVAAIGTGHMLAGLIASNNPAAKALELSGFVLPGESVVVSGEA